MTNTAETALSAIYHYETLGDLIGCSGQPKADQFQLIQAAGYRAVINLALPDSDHAIADEGSIVTGLGMSYHHIPVKFDAPCITDLRLFNGVMQALQGQRVWVHCVVNARVSAFLFLHLHRLHGLPATAARTQLLDKWEPQMDDVWQEFLRTPKAAMLQPEAIE
ncbi:MAG: protein tyrosine phosphatase family protein [Pseudomonadota bacterium]